MGKSMEKIIKLSWKKKTFLCVLSLCAFSVLFWWIAEDQMAQRSFTVSTVSPGAVVTLAPGDVLVQPIKMPDGRLEALNVQYSHVDGPVSMRVLLGDTVLGSAQNPGMADANGYVRFAFDPAIEAAEDAQLTIELTAENESAIYHGLNISTGRYEITMPDVQVFRVADQTYDGMLVMQLDASKPLIFAALYWPLMALIVLCVLLVLFRMKRRREAGLNSRLNATLELYYRYKFLIDQLVSRDFKTKYKRSVLGVLWSFLNPLLTMLVQYVVFSTLFKSNIPYFAVYLLTGTVIFNFFTESVGQGLMGIVSNASLITKVYLPKYIYPISKVLSSCVNLLIAFVPLFLVSLVMGLPVTKAHLLLPVGVAFLMMFCVGMALLLSASMTFFRDTLFLWNVASTLWSYLTPLFYPESIIPAQFLGVYRCNPMYQFITFIRTIMIDGVSPDPMAYIGCLLWGAGTLALGLLVFKKKQDRFVYYL